MSSYGQIAIATHAARGLIGDLSDQGTLLGLESFCDWAAKAGFDGLDIATSVFDVEHSDAWWWKVMNVITDRGLVPASINCLRSSLADEDYWQLGDRRIRRAIEIAVEYAIPTVNISLAVPPQRLDANAFRLIQLPPGSSRTATAMEVENTKQRLAAIRQNILSSGPELVLELHHCSVVDTSVSLAEVLSDVEGYTANPDLYNEIWAFDEIDIPWQKSLEILAPLTKGIWHVKNATLVVEGGNKKFLNSSLGAGDIDDNYAVATMLESGFKGWISIEKCGVCDFQQTASEGLAFLVSRLG